MIGSKLKSYRLSLKVTGETLAGLAGIKRSWLSQIENEKKYPPVDTFMNLIEAVAKISPITKENANDILTEERYLDFRKMVRVFFDEIPEFDDNENFVKMNTEYRIMYLDEELLNGYIIGNMDYDYDLGVIKNKNEIEKLIKDFFFNSYKYDSSNVSSLVDKLFILPRDNKLDVPLYNIEEIKIPLYEWWYNHILKDFYDTFNTDIEITNEELVIFGALMSLVNPDGTFTPYNSDDITNIPKSLLNEKIVTFDISYIKDKNLRLTLDGKPLSNPEVDMLDVSLSAIRYKREKNK